MQSFVTILQIIYNCQPCIKCVISSLNNEEILEAHEKVYGIRPIVIDKIKIYNTKIFLEFLDKLSQFRVSFVTVSFDNEYQSSHVESKLPFRFYCEVQRNLILELVETINKLCAIVSSGIDSYTQANLKVEHSIISKIFIMRPKPIFPSDPCVEQYLTFTNDNFYYDPSEVLHLFPEFQITCFDFPRRHLAVDMFNYKILQGCPSKHAVLEINKFFEQDCETQPHFLQISDLNTDYTKRELNLTDLERKQIIEKFLNLHIEKGGPGDKIKSNILFEEFVKRMGTEGNPISQTKFGIIIKGMLDSKRENSGVYFFNVKLLNQT